RRSDWRRGQWLPYAKLLDWPASSVGSLRHSGGGGVSLRLEHLPDPARPVWAAPGASLPVRDLAKRLGAARRVPHRHNPVPGSELPDWRRWLLPPVTVRVGPLGHPARQRAGATAGDVLPSSLGTRPGPAPPADGVASPLSSLRGSREGSGEDLSPAGSISLRYGPRRSRVARRGEPAARDGAWFGSREVGVAHDGDPPGSI